LTRRAGFGIFTSPLHDSGKIIRIE